MQEVVSSVKRVTEIMGEISVASMEQTAGIEEVSNAIGDMDGMTQKNTALVEEAAAAAQELEHQASVLAQVVGVFKLDETPRAGASAVAARKSAAPDRSARPVRRLVAV